MRLLYIHSDDPPYLLKRCYSYEYFPETVIVHEGEVLFFHLLAEHFYTLAVSVNFFHRVVNFKNFKDTDSPLIPPVTLSAPPLTLRSVV